MLITIGENKETIDPWVNFVPDDYGLCIVKSGLLVLMKLAQRHADKRQKIIDGFSEIQQTICNATLKRRSFQTDAQVCETAGNLYVSIVDAIEKLLDIVLSPSTISKSADDKTDMDTKNKEAEARSLKAVVRDTLMRPVFYLDTSLFPGSSFLISTPASGLGEEKKNSIGKKTSVDEILENIHKSVKEFEAAGDTCRDQHIEATHVKANEVLNVSTRTSDQIRDLGDQSSNRFDNLDHGLLKCMDLLQILLQSREEATDTLRILLSGLQKGKESKEEQPMKREQEPQLYKKSEQATPVNIQQQKAVISFRRLLQILSAPAPDQIPVGHNGIDFQHILAQRGEDLEAVVNWGPKVDPSAQAQARSILDQDRFLQWMSSEHPDMLLIDRKLFTRGSVSIEKISAMSLFCAYFILSMAILHNRGLLDLNILDRRSFVQALENHSLDELCTFFHQLIRQFPTDITIFLVVDGISHFDLDLNGLFKKFATVLECLQRIVEDDNLRPKFKVLMTSPTNTSWRLSQVADKKHRLGLPSMRMAPLPLSQARMKTALGSGRPE